MGQTMRKTRLLALFAAVLVALALAACASGGGSSDATGAEGMTVENVSSSVVKVTLGGTSDVGEVEVTVNEGESFVIAGNLESGEVEVTTTMAEGDMTDYFYEGYGISETEIGPGTVTVTIAPGDATGTIYILSYPTGQLDFMNTDSETLFDQVVEFAGA